MGRCDVCLTDEDELDGLTCADCMPEGVDRTAVERETVAAIVKWLRREAAKHNGPMPGVDPVGSVRVIADAIERGDWRER